MLCCLLVRRNDENTCYTFFMDTMQDSGTTTINNSMGKFKYLGITLTNQNCNHGGREELREYVPPFSPQS